MAIDKKHSHFYCREEVEKEQEKMQIKVMQNLRADVQNHLLEMSHKDIKSISFEIPMEEFMMGSLESVVKELEENGFKAEIKVTKVQDPRDGPYSITKLFISILAS